MNIFWIIGLIGVNKKVLGDYCYSRGWGKYYVWDLL